MYLGGLNLVVYRFSIVTFPVLPREDAVVATPEVIDEPAFKVAVIGAEIAPRKPEPRPLNKPLTPSYLVFSTGFVKIPVNPPTSSDTPPFTPRYNPSKK